MFVKSSKQPSFFNGPKRIFGLSPLILLPIIIVLFNVRQVNGDIDPIPKVVRSILKAANYNKNEMPHPNSTDCK